MNSALRIGIVGAGRTRNGLGPFLASAFERAGGRVVGVAGRDPAAGRHNAKALGERLGHAVTAFASAPELAAAVDLLVVASPAGTHLQGLQAALAAGVPCLCEKPFVLPEQTDRGLELVAAFASRDLVLVENCQWPQVLPTFYALYPGLVGTPVETVEMGLCPAAGGRAMVLDSLSHVLSVVQAVAEVEPAGEALVVREEDPGAGGPDGAERRILRFDLALAGSIPAASGPPRRTVAVALHLERRDRQPRPAWLAVNGRRVDRRIGEHYAQFLVADDEREEPLPDPLAALVYRLPALLTPAQRDDASTHRQSIATRLRCFRSVVDALDRQ